MLSAIHDFYMTISDPHEITFGAVMAMFVVVGSIMGFVMLHIIRRDDAKYEATKKHVSR